MQASDELARSSPCLVRLPLHHSACVCSLVVWEIPVRSFVLALHVRAQRESDGEVQGGGLRYIGVVQVLRTRGATRNAGGAH